MINLSIETQTFPARWEVAKVIPLFKRKKSYNLNPANYRPISILPVISKLAEHAI